MEKLIFSRNFFSSRYQCRSTFRYAFSHPQQCRHPVCRKRTYLEVLYRCQGSTNHKRVKLINKKEFAKVVWNENSETFIIFVISPNLIPGLYPDKAAQITSLLADKVKILVKYSDFAYVLLEKKALVLPERTKLN